MTHTCNILSFIEHYFFSAMDDSHEVFDPGTRMYCMKCIQLSVHPCTCIMCDVCNIHYVDLKAHNCLGFSTNCEKCQNTIISMSQLCVHCDFDTIYDMCGIVTPLNQLGFPQCLRCLQPLENNMACGCSPCPDCLIYLPVGKVHRCTKMRNICIDCNNVIISFSKSCLYCVTNKKKIYL